MERNLTVSSDREHSDHLAYSFILGPVIPSIVSLMMLVEDLLSLTVPLKSIVAVFFAEKV